MVVAVVVVVDGALDVSSTLVDDDGGVWVHGAVWDHDHDHVDVNV